jgi:hypothetical protein
VESNSPRIGAIYCDEAGNSGQNLLDPEQPVFVLASTDFGVLESAELIQKVSSPQGGEPKFSTLKRTRDGQRRLGYLLTDPRLNKSRVVLTAFHKRYMIVTKMVDLIAETIFHQLGKDLYKRGANIAMSNMLYACMPVFCGGTTTDQFVQAFVDLMRFRTDQHVEKFYIAGAAMVEACSDEDFCRSLYPFTERQLFHDWFDGIGEFALDPAIPALFQHIAAWGVRKSDRFKVIHDQSKPVIATKVQFEAMMAQSQELSTLVGYDRRKFRFPLRAVSVEQGNSVDHPQLQIADICAGSLVHFLKRRETGQLDELASLVKDLCLDWVVDAIVPSKSITPSELGTDDSSGMNPIDPIVLHALKKRAASRD